MLSITAHNLARSLEEPFIAAVATGFESLGISDGWVQSKAYAEGASQFCDVSRQKKWVNRATHCRGQGERTKRKGKRITPLHVALATETSFILEQLVDQTRARTGLDRVQSNLDSSHLLGNRKLESPAAPSRRRQSASVLGVEGFALAHCAVASVSLRNKFQADANNSRHGADVQEMLNRSPIESIQGVNAELESLRSLIEDMLPSDEVGGVSLAGGEVAREDKVVSRSVDDT
ncbi:hypothetical protein DFH06DRAFT_1131272 [Mycena polygramma]|nr:hypothetical protein DFH06DRAFT_1131272 [Mycena polygramma]